MKNSPALFQSLFGEKSAELPAPLRLRYALHPFTDEVIVMKGKMNIDYSRMMNVFLPIMRLLKILVPYKGQAVPVTLHFKSEKESPAFQFTREFYFPEKKPYRFCSRMECHKQNELIEVMRFGIAWRAHCFYDGEKIQITHKDYAFKLCGKFIPLPFGLLIGKTYAEEQATSDHTFKMRMTMTHPLFGKMFEYTGEFTTEDLSQ